MNNSSSNKSFEEISFGQGRGYHIHDQAIIAHVNNAIVQRARINMQNGNKYFKVFEAADLMTLKQMPHKVTFNLKGKQPNGYLYLFKYQQRPFCIYIREKSGENQNYTAEHNEQSDSGNFRKDKDYDYIMVKHRFNETLYNGTLFQGNFLQINQYQNIFLVSDLLIWKDRAHLDSLSDKIPIMNDVLKTKFSSDPGLDTHQILVKEYCDYNQINDFMNNYRNTLPYRDLINGILFRPEVRNQRLIYLVLNRPGQVPGLEPVEAETKEETLQQNLITVSKVEPVMNVKKQEDRVEKISKPTIDHQKFAKIVFLMKKTSKQDVYELYLADYVPKYGIAAVVSLQHSEEIRGWFSSGATEIVVEAEYVSNFNKWKPVQQVAKPVSSLNEVSVSKVKL